MPFIRNAWYVAAWADELGDQPLARTILGAPVVFFRRADRTPVALEDRCCHRALPLSLGRIEGDRLRCGYHGLLFDAAGACVEVPGQTQVPPGSRVRSYPTVETLGAVWIWPGDPKRADRALVPDAYWLDDPGWTTASSYLRVGADYRLLVDNLLDLTHVSYLHRSTLAGDDVEAVTPVETRREEKRIVVGRWMRNVSAPPLYTAASGIGGTVDRWQWITWNPPGNVFFDIGCAKAGTGAPEGDRSQGISMWSTHLITPETETSSHYFFSFVRNYRLGEPPVTEILRDGARHAFLEDLGVLEAQQKALLARPDAPTVDINIDKAPLQSRRILDGLIRAEAHGESASRA